MDPDRWQRIQTLFVDAVDLGPGPASEYLTDHCPDTGIRVEVEALIRNLPEAEAFFSAAASSPPDETPGELQTGDRIGHYQIVRRLGRGGMGTVFLAARADGEFQKQVAIKVMRSAMATPMFLRQFHAERQILARLEHPHIGRLLDTGLTDSGLPYLILEYVEGLPITRWCDGRAKSIGERLVLFRSVCAAVHHAHQHLVVHGDIKPGNIFVTPDGSPKLLDFGVGKLIGEVEPEVRGSSILVPRLLTPEYASPEQRRGDSLTTESDIYSLGVLLAELLTGRLPSAGHEGTESRRLSAMGFTDEAAQRRKSTPLKLRRLLRGDLEAIVERALSHDPAQRYLSAERFSDDISRHLSGQTVSALPATWGYRTRKYVRRHNFGFAAAVVLCLALIQIAVLAKARHDENSRRLDEITALAIQDQVDLNDETLEFPGTLGIRADATGSNLDLLEQLLRETPGDMEIQSALAYFYRRMALIQNGSYVQHLGHSGAAIAYARKSLAAYEQLGGQPVPARLNVSPRIGLFTRTPGQILHVYAQLGDILSRTRYDFAAADELHGREEAVITRISGGKEGVEREADWQMSNLVYRKAEDSLRQNAPAVAIRWAEESVDRLDRLKARYPYDEDFGYSQSYAEVVMAQAFLMEGDAKSAIRKLEIARPGLEESATRHPAWVSPEAHLIKWRLTMASALSDAGRCAEAEAEAQNAVSHARTMAAIDPLNKFGDETLAASLLSAGKTFRACHRNEAARDFFGSAVQMWSALVRHDPENVAWRSSLEDSRKAGLPGR